MIFDVVAQYVDILFIIFLFVSSPAHCSSYGVGLGQKGS